MPIALLAAYAVLQRRRTKYALRFTNLPLLDQVAPDRPGWRRHLAAAGLVGGLILATFAAARPAVAHEVSDRDAIVMLAIDTSLSMRATDVAPDRLSAAQAAAHKFLDDMPEHTRVGLVAFDGTASVVTSPTEDRAAVGQAIDRLELGEGTAIGSAVHASLGAIEAATASGLGLGLGLRPRRSTTAAADATPSATIVVLSDGETNMGVPNDTAAQEAVAAHIAVNTIAFGTDNGTVRDPNGEQVRVPVNAQALAELAQQTSGQAFTAETAGQLQDAFGQLGKAVNHHQVVDDVADWFAGGAFMVLAGAGVASLLWFSRLP